MVVGRVVKGESLGGWGVGGGRGVWWSMVCVAFLCIKAVMLAMSERTRAALMLCFGRSDETRHSNNSPHVYMFKRARRPAVNIEKIQGFLRRNIHCKQLRIGLDKLRND